MSVKTKVQNQGFLRIRGIIRCGYDDEGDCDSDRMLILNSARLQHIDMTMEKVYPSRSESQTTSDDSELKPPTLHPIVK